MARRQKGSSNIIILILAIALLRGVLYAVLVPPWQAPDEPFHFEYVAELSNKYFPRPAASPSVQAETISSLARWDFWRYHDQTVPNPLPWGFSAIPLFKTIRYLDRSPTYYYLMLPFYLLAANQDIELRLYLLRLVNAVLGALTVGIAYLTSRAVFPKDEHLSVGVAGFVAFFPMFSFISGSLNNDNLANLLFALFVLFYVKNLNEKPSLLYSALLVVTAFLALLTKRSTVSVAPLLLLFPPLVLFRNKPAGRRDFLWRASGVLAGIVILSLLALKVWYSTPLKAQIRNLLNFHYYLSDVAAKFVGFFGPNAWLRTRTNLAYLFQGFWGHYGWQNIPLDSYLYTILAVVSLLAVLGLVLSFLPKTGAGRLLKREQKISFLFLILAVITTVVIAFMRTTVLEFVPLQGRYIFPVLVPVAIIFVFGLNTLFLKKFQNAAVVALLAGLVVLDLVSWASYLLPAHYLV